MSTSTKTEAIVGYLLPVAPILVPLTVHFILVCFVLLSLWLPFTYIFSHLVLFGVGLWACHVRTEILPAILFVGVVLITILLDIIMLGLHFSDGQDAYGGGHSTTARTWQFSAGMCIINLILKPMTVALGCLAVYIRAGGAIKGLGSKDSYSTLPGADNPSPSAE